MVFKKIARIILRNRLLISIVLVAITGAMIWFARTVDIAYASYRSLLPRNDSAFVDLQRLKAKFGEEANLLVISLSGGHLHSQETFQEWRRINREVKKHLAVEEVLSPVEAVQLIKESKQRKFKTVPYFPDTLSPEAFAHRMKQFLKEPFYQTLFFDSTQTVFLTLLSLNKELLDSKEREVAIPEIIDKYGQLAQNHHLEMRIAGVPHLRVVNTVKMRGETIFFSILALVVCFLTLWIVFRSLRESFFPLLVVSVNVIWCLGIMGIMGYKITALSGMLPTLLIIIGFANSIFFINQYHREIACHNNKIKSLQRIITKIGQAALMTNATTAIGFGAFMVTYSPMMKEFGLVAFLSILCSFLLSILIIPLLFSVFPSPSQKKVKHLSRRSIRKMIKNLLRLTRYRRKVVYLVTVCLTLGSLVGTQFLQTSGRLTDDLPQNDKANVDLLFLDKCFEGVIPLDLMIDAKVKGSVFKVKFLRKTEELVAKIAAIEGVSQPLSVLNAIKLARQSYYNGLSKFYSIPPSREIGLILSHVGKDTTQGVRRLVLAYVDSTQQFVRVSFRVNDFPIKKMKALHQEVEALCQTYEAETGYHVLVTGSAIGSYIGNEYLVNGLFLSISLAIVVIVLLMAIIFHNIEIVLIAILTNLLPLLFTAGLMGFIGIPIKASTVLVFNIVFGISVDNTIHFFSKFKQGLGKEKKAFKALNRAIREAGVSMIYTGAVLVVGFAVFILSDFGGTKALGILSVATLIMALATNLILFPAIMLSSLIRKGDVLIPRVSERKRVGSKI